MQNSDNLNDTAMLYENFKILPVNVSADRESSSYRQITKFTEVGMTVGC